MDPITRQERYLNAIAGGDNDVPETPQTREEWFLNQILENGDTKLDAPTTAGTSGQVLTSDGNGSQVWATVGSGSIVVDDTLSVEGAAADAKAAGDELADVKSAVDEIDGAVDRLDGAVGQLEAGSLSALNANNGDVPVAKGDGTWEWGTTQSVIYSEAKTVKVGSNTLGVATLSTGWSEIDGVYTHTSGDTGELDFTTGLSENDIALLEFDTTFTTAEFVKVGIGTAYQILVYNATSHICVPLKAIGNTTLHITPLSTFNGSISNLSLRKIQDSGTEVTLEYKDVLTVNHEETYGFWNTLLGYNTAENAVGSTRCVAIGYNALRDLQGGHRNVALGTFALSKLIGGERNISIGADSMLGVTGGNSNVSIGDGALYNGIAPADNVSIGPQAHYGNASKSPTGNVVIGKEAGFYNGGNNNTFIGKQAGYRNRNGSYNVMIGGQAFGSNGGDNNTFVGYNISSLTALSDAIGLGDSAVPTKSNQMMLGSNTITEVVFCGNKKILFNNDGTVTWEALT